MSFGGRTFDPALDEQRLLTQLGRVFDAMRDGQWWTIPQLYSHCVLCRTVAGLDGADSHAGISARIRDLRKPRFGGYEVEHERVSGGLWRYRLQVPEQRVLVAVPAGSYRLRERRDAQS